MNKLDHYRQYFTKEYLMGPNSFRLLEELLRRNPFETRFDRTLDLGCGMALTSVFLANETPAKSVYAFDLWVNATDNLKRIRSICPLRRTGLTQSSAWIPITTLAAGMAYSQKKSCRLSGRMVRS